METNLIETKASKEIKVEEMFEDQEAKNENAK